MGSNRARDERRLSARRQRVQPRPRPPPRSPTSSSSSGASRSAPPPGATDGGGGGAGSSGGVGGGGVGSTPGARERHTLSPRARAAAAEAVGASPSTPSRRRGGRGSPTSGFGDVMLPRAVALPPPVSAPSGGAAGGRNLRISLPVSVSRDGGVGEGSDDGGGEVRGVAGGSPPNSGGSPAPASPLPADAIDSDRGHTSATETVATASPLTTPPPPPR